MPNLIQLFHSKTNDSSDQRGMICASIEHFAFGHDLNSFDCLDSNFRTDIASPVDGMIVQAIADGNDHLSTLWRSSASQRSIASC